MESIKKEAMKVQKSLMELTGILYKGKMENQQMLIADSVTDDIAQYMNTIVAESKKIHDRMMEGQGKLAFYKRELAFTKKRAAEEKLVYDESTKHIKEELNSSQNMLKLYDYEIESSGPPENTQEPYAVIIKKEIDARKEELVVVEEEIKDEAVTQELFK